MPNFRFRGFETGSPVSIAATQDGSSDSASVSTWGEQGAPTSLPAPPSAGAGSLSLAVTLPTRITAPAGVWLNASGQAGFATGPGGAVYDAGYHEITHIWDTGDTGVWSAPDNMPTQWNDKSRAIGPRVAHVYDTPGSYTPFCGGVDENRTTGRDTLPAITVLDADDIYTGTNTVCFSNDAGETWAGVPAGCQQVTSISALQSTINASSGPIRILFKRGITVNDFYLNIQSKRVEYVGAWGAGTDPRPTLYGRKFVSAPESWMFNYLNNSVIEQITITDLNLRSHWFSNGEVGYATTPWWVNGVKRDNVHFTIHNCSFDGFDALDLALASGGNRPGTVIMADCEVTNWRSYGVFVNRNSNANFKMAILGNKIAQSTDALHGTNYQQNDITGNDHGPIRFEAVGQHYIGVNDLYSQCGWSALAPDAAQQPCIRVNTYADQAAGYVGNIERNVMEGGYHTINMSGENGGRVEHPGNYLIDMNIAIGNAKSAEASSSGIGIFCSFGGTTIRNFLYALPDVAHHHDNGNPSRAVISLHVDNSGPGNQAEAVSIYNCTALNLRGSTNDPGFTWDLVTNQGSWSNLTIENNLVHAPGLDTPAIADGPLRTEAFVDITPRTPGFLFKDPHITGSTGSVPQNSSFTVSYPSGKPQSYWQGRDVSDRLHLLRIADSTTYHADAGHFEVDFSSSSNIRIWNRQGTTWSGAYELVLDEKSLLSIPNTFANPATIPLPRPDAGSDALSDGDNGRKAYTDLLGAVRPEVGNDRGALLK